MKNKSLNDQSKNDQDEIVDPKLNEQQTVDNKNTIISFVFTDFKDTKFIKNKNYYLLFNIINIMPQVN